MKGQSNGDIPTMRSCTAEGIPTEIASKIIENSYQEVGFFLYQRCHPI